MLNINRHKIVLVKILKEIYSDPALRNILGFKGGTAAYLFYGLPRFSVDLDFDLLKDSDQQEIYFQKTNSVALSPCSVNIITLIKWSLVMIKSMSLPVGKTKL